MTGAALGATALFAPSAQAADFTVDVLTDGPPDACDPGACTLRDAVTLANGNGAGEDRITFAAGLTGQIVLTQGEIEITGPDITIDGPGRDVLSVSGDSDANGLDAGDFRIFTVSGDRAVIDGLTLTEGAGNPNDSGTGPGGAVRVDGGAELAITDSAITGSTATDGGGAYTAGVLVLDGTRVAGNSANNGGGVALDGDERGGELFVTGGSEIADNTAANDGAGIYGNGPVTVEQSTISGNTGADVGGGIYSSGKYGALEVTDSVISGNGADYGAGVGAHPDFGKYNRIDRLIERTTLVDNTAQFAGGGVYVSALGAGDEFTISRSTISGNEAEGGIDPGTGGGLAIATDDEFAVVGDLLVSNSTISGNAADLGGGVSIGGYDGGGRSFGGTVDFANSTIASNVASTSGGGIYLSAYSAGDEQTSSSIPLLTSTIVADNTADGAGQDLDRADGSDGGGFDSAFSLIEAPGDAPILQDAGDANILGSDPQLGALGDNGGPTPTHVPAATSPAIDKGDAVPRDDTDQRGAQRTQDGTGPSNPEGGDGTDIGSVEIDRVQAPPAPPQEQPAPQQPQQQPGPQQPAQQQPTVIIRRFPSGLTLSTTPRRDLKGPWTFRSTGKVIPPAGMTEAEACRTIGVVTVQVKRNGTTISNRPALVQPDCTYSSSVTFRYKQRFGRARNLKFTARFGGNQLLEPIVSRSLLRRVQ